MTAAELARSGGAGEVQIHIYGIGIVKSLTQRIYLVSGEIFEFVESLTYLTLLVSGDGAEIIKQSRH